MHNYLDLQTSLQQILYKRVTAQTIIFSSFLFLLTFVSPSKKKRNWKHSKLTVAMSMDAVASSMMKMLVFRTKALAKQKSCLWPWLKFSPPSVTIASGKDTAKTSFVRCGWEGWIRAEHLSRLQHKDFQSNISYPLKLLMAQFCLLISAAQNNQQFSRYVLYTY